MRPNRHERRESRKASCGGTDQRIGSEAFDQCHECQWRSRLRDPRRSAEQAEAVAVVGGAEHGERDGTTRDSGSNWFVTPSSWENPPTPCRSPGARKMGVAQPLSGCRSRICPVQKFNGSSKSACPPIATVAFTEVSLACNVRGHVSFWDVASTMRASMRAAAPLGLKTVVIEQLHVVGAGGTWCHDLKWVSSVDGAPTGAAECHLWYLP